MEAESLGNACALGAAATWAVALVLFKRTGERVTPIALNLFKNVVGLVLLGGTLLVLGEGFESLRRYPLADIGILMLSGFIGITLADTIFLEALNTLGVGLISIVECLYSPCVMLFAFVLLAERMSGWDYVGAVLILTGVLVSSRHTPPVGRTRRQLVVGIAGAAVAMVMMAFGIVIAKPVLEIDDFPVIWAAAVRLLVGTVALAVITLASPARKAHWSVFRPSSVWKFSVPASIFGAYVSMILWIAGFKYAQASIAGVLNQMTVVFAMILAAIFLREGFDRRKCIAAALALSGAVIVTLD